MKSIVNEIILLSCGSALYVGIVLTAARLFS
jgi:hypothetical protein